MGIFRRRRHAASHESDKEKALLDAQRALARLRAAAEDLERYRAGKQAAPATRMTQNQRIAGGG